MAAGVPTIGWMSVPSRHDAAALLLSLQPPDRLVGHSAAVAEVASFLAGRAVARGTRLDQTLVETAALLHDVDKALPRDHPLLTMGHGEAGAAWLAEQGHRELGPAVAGHTVTLLTDERRYPRWAAEASLEARVVAYADKRARQEIVSLEERFDTWLERHPEHGDGLRRGLDRARRLEQEVCALAGVEPDAVGRAPWVDEVLRSVGDG